MKQHHYEISTIWTGNDGGGTGNYRGYRRDHEIIADQKLTIPASSDPAFRGDPTRYNPEELLVGSVSSCHMLWYLHLCAVNKVVVQDYRDQAVGVMQENADGSGQFERVTLRPAVKVSRESDPAKAQALHEEAHRYCFIARSVNFPIEIEGTVTAG